MPTTHPEFAKPHAGMFSFDFRFVDERLDAAIHGGNPILQTRS